MSKDHKYLGILESKKLDPSAPFEDRFKFIKDIILKTANIISLEIMRNHTLWMDIKDGKDFGFVFIISFNSEAEALEMKERLDQLK